MDNRFIKLYFSILTACVTGVALSFILIFLFKYSKIVISQSKNKVEKQQTLPSQVSQKSQLEKSNLNINDLKVIDEEETADPTFISRFSRVAVYSADSGRETIESAKQSLPKFANKKITAKSYIVSDIDRDAVVLEKDADKLMPIASITKIVTAVVAKRLIKENESIIIDSKALSTYGNEARLRDGEKFKLRELLYPLLMVSSNDSSEAIARHYGRQKFIKEMNNFVSEIGAYRTYFKDPSGLSPSNVSTVNDLLIITKYIIKNYPEIFEITKEKSKTIRTHTWTNTTHLLNLDSYFGGKNGYTPEANRTSISLFKLGKNERFFAVIFLGSSSRDNDILDLLEDAVR